MSFYPAPVGWGVRCPKCGSDDNAVKDSRPTTAARTRRRRMCIPCGERFTTMEKIEGRAPELASYTETQLIGLVARFSHRQRRTVLIFLRSMLPR